MSDLRQAFEYMTDVDAAVQALQEVELYRRKQGEFGRPLAEKMAYDHNTLLASWWAMFGVDTPTLQMLVLRLVSQCCSSNGYERN